MNLLKEEKKFWQRHFRIEKLEDIPQKWSGYKSIDSDNDDEFLYFFTLRVSSILEIHLKDTLVTDEGVKHIAKLKDLEILYLRNHSKITKASIPFFNEMTSLQSLNITKTEISLSDICDSLDNQSLKEVFLDSEDDEESILEKVIILKERMPDCSFYLNTSFTTDVFENPIAPIF
ncbi:hypothetical protein [Roseivirga echinicomitans]|uniref:Uncharacterized protein n=1 Tax=Roseivirga echinicomitans TaxID=296218 RepID=A0A150X9J3_9BACT|nr:hypothetical protein [Roseivirga echinicomitans]KYG75373.1 hypothetical protein AWN68_07435 [Roseivirga echinicomitans]